MELSQAAAALSKKGVQVRTRRRQTLCIACGKSFTARSAKAQFCSKSCLAKVWYSRKNDDTYSKLRKIHQLVDALIGTNPRIDATLKKISKLFILAKMDSHQRIS